MHAFKKPKNNGDDTNKVTLLPLHGAKGQHADPTVDLSSTASLADAAVRRLLTDTKHEKRNNDQYRRDLLEKSQQQAAAYNAIYDPAEEDEIKDWVRIPFINLKLLRKSKKGKLRFFVNVLLTIGYSLACGLTVMGSLLAISSMPGIIPYLGLFFTTLVNWRIAKNKVPDVMSMMFFEKFGRYLFKYTAAEYEQILIEYFAEQDDQIQRLRDKITLMLDEKQSLANGQLSFWQERKYNYYVRQLQRFLDDRQHGRVPNQSLPWYKKGIIVFSMPLNLAASVVVGMLTYSLAIKSLLAIAGLAALATPPGWVIAISVLLAVITIPIMAGLFTSGVSSLVKVNNGARKALQFLLDFFKTSKEVVHPLTQEKGLVKVYTPASVIKGIFKSSIVIGLIALVTTGVIAQSYGAGAGLVELFKDWASTGLQFFFMNLVPVMAIIAQSPFYWKQTTETLKSWFTDGLDYFKNPVDVIHKQIQNLKKLIAGGELGYHKGHLLIQGQEQQQAKILDEEKTLQEKSFTVDLSKSSWAQSIPLLNKIKFSVAYGKLQQKIPYWIRDAIFFQTPRALNAGGNGFIAFYGAGASAAAGGDAAAMQGPTVGQYIAITGGTLGSFFAGGKDPAEKLKQYTEAKRVKELRKERRAAYSNETSPLIAQGITRLTSTRTAGANNYGMNAASAGHDDLENAAPTPLMKEKSKRSSRVIPR